MRRRASLHLTYYAYGDTRKRGSLLRFKHAYRQAGMQLSDSELPDYLPLVLEFAATVDQQQGERLLAEHVPVLELLRSRITIAAVRKATSRSDKMMYLLLAAALLTGMMNTLTNVFDTYNYRETVSPWFRNLFSLHPAPELMADAPWTFQLHAIVVLALLAIWPYTRLVHMFSAPVGYLVRPYVVYRSRDPQKSPNNRYAKAWVEPEAPPARSRWCEIPHETCRNHHFTCLQANSPPIIVSRMYQSGHRLHRFRNKAFLPWPHAHPHTQARHRQLGPRGRRRLEQRRCKASPAAT